MPAADRTLSFARTVARLARPVDIRALPVAVMRLVLVMRWQPLFAQAEREPLAELSVRLGSVAAAIAALDFAREARIAWPEAIAVNRPCRLQLTPDEHTVALIAQAAAAGDRPAFAAALDGFVRTKRHDRLYDATVRALAELDRVGTV